MNINMYNSLMVTISRLKGRPGEIGKKLGYIDFAARMLGKITGNTIGSMYYRFMFIGLDKFPPYIENKDFYIQRYKEETGKAPGDAPIEEYLFYLLDRMKSELQIPKQKFLFDTVMAGIEMDSDYIAHRKEIDIAYNKNHGLF